MGCLRPRHRFALFQRPIPATPVRTARRLVGVIAATVWCGLTAAYLQSSARLVVEDLAITDPITNNTFVIPASHLR